MNKILSFFSVSLLPAALTLGQSLISVGPNVHVSKANATRPHYEIHLAADHDSTGQLLGGTMVWYKEENEYKVLAYVSSDGGARWEPSLEVDIGEYTNDPACAFGSSGMAYFVCFGGDEERRSKMLFYRSKDGGRNWLPPTEVPVFDREFITVDNTGGKFQGRVYINGTSGARRFDKGAQSISGLKVMFSTDQGETFRAPTMMGSEANHYVLGMGNGAVFSDGTLIVLFGERRDRDNIKRPDPIPTEPNAWLKVITSENGGERFSEATIVSEWYQRFASTTSVVPQMAIDGGNGPFKDRAYVVWEDYRLGRSEIYLAFSSDKGKSWSKPRLVDRSALDLQYGRGPNSFMPVVAVNHAGVIGVSWYDRRNSPDNLGWWVKFAASLDGGETFLPSVRVSEAPFDYSLEKSFVIWASTTGGGNPSEYLRGGALRAEIGVHHFNNKGGDTGGMASDAVGVFHPFWIDNRTGIPQIWTAAVTVGASAVKNGSTELQNLEDLSQKVTLQFSNVSYDPSSRKAITDLRIHNTSSDTLAAPLKLRVLILRSAFGVPTILNSDNREKGVGSVLDFSSLMKGDRLLPKEKTAAKRIEFQLSDARALRPPEGPMTGRGGESIVNIEAKVLGNLPPKVPK